MNIVYENAYCNLSTTGSTNSSQGLFFDRDPNLIRQDELSTAFTVFDPAVTMTNSALVDADYRNIHLSRMPLYERGWVLQERLLARRVLHFCSSQMAWECVETDADETHPDGLLVVLDETPIAHFKSLDPSIVGKRLKGSGLRLNRDQESLHIFYGLESSGLTVNACCRRVCISSLPSWGLQRGCV